MQLKRDELEQICNHDAGSLSYQDGQYYFQKYNKKHIKKEIERINHAINDFRSNFEITPVVIPENRSEMEKRVIEKNQYWLDPIYAASSEKLALLSDDWAYRSIAVNEHNVQGLWLQVVLLFGLEQNKITIKDYTKAIIRLAKLKHSYITLSVDTLFEACKIGENDELDGFKHLIEFVGGGNADLKSHLTLVIKFIDKLWENSGISYFHKQRATGLILRRIAGLATRFGVFRQILGKFIGKTSPQARNYIISWLRGHFIDFK